MIGLIEFLASTSGRLTRVVAGAVLVVVGLFALGGAAGVILAVVGAVPLLAGVFDVCVFAPLAALPFSGARIRRLSGR
jgi:Inner membrane protein YgaP-like, transmembrane domain